METIADELPGRLPLGKGVWVLAALLTFLPAAPLTAQEKQEAKILPAPPKDPAKVEAHRKAAEAVVDAVGTKNQFALTLGKMLNGQLEQFSEAGASEEGVAELRAATLAFLEKIYVWDEIKPDFVKAYMEAFTADELSKIAEFYGSPVGQKTIIVMPRVAAKSAQIGQSRLVDNQEEFAKRVRPIFEKYLPDTEFSSEAIAGGEAAPGVPGASRPGEKGSDEQEGAAAGTEADATQDEAPEDESNG